MIYQKYSLVGYMLWLRYGLMKGKPGISLSEVYDKYLESPRTKAYTEEEGRRLFEEFSEVKVWTKLSFGDLLQGEVGQRHQGGLLSLAKKVWPRWFFKRFFNKHGLYLFVEARK